MSQVAKAGRRTPLSLGPTKPRKASADLTTDKPELISIAEKVDEVNVEQLKAKVQSSTKTKVENGQNNGPTAIGVKNGAESAKVQNSKKEMETKNGTETKNEKSKATAAPSSANVEQKNDKTKESPSMKTNENKNEKNKATNGVQKTEKVNEEKVDAKAKDNVRESPRQRELKEKEMKEKQTKDKDEPAKLKSEQTPKGLDKKDKGSDLLESVVPITPELTPSKDSPQKKNETGNITMSQTGDSILFEKDLKGFGADGVEIDSLIMEPGPDSPMPKSKTSKLVKLKQGPPTRARVSPLRRSDKLENASTIVNLSTVSERSVESGTGLTPSMDGMTFGSSIRMISGRKSTRPLREISFQHTMRESYRRLATDFNDSTASMNATVGSDNRNESLRSPAIATIKGKRRATFETETSESYELDTSKSPSKKARLDISGFLGVLASPVTALRARFQRAQIQCSTPNAKQLNDNDNNVTIGSECNENSAVLEIPTTETADVIMIDDDIATTTENINDTAEEANEDITKLLEDDEKIDVDEAPIEVKEIKKSRCSLM